MKTTPKSSRLILNEMERLGSLSGDELKNYISELRAALSREHKAMNVREFRLREKLKTVTENSDGYSIRLTNVAPLSFAIFQPLNVFKLVFILAGVSPQTPRRMPHNNKVNEKRIQSGCPARSH